MKLSQSVLSSSQDCLRKAQYTLVPPPGTKRTASAARAVGTGYHAGIELLYAARHQGETEPTLDDMIGRAITVFNDSTVTDLYDNTPVDIFLWDDKVPDSKTAHGLIGKMLTEYVEGGHVWPGDWRVLGVEIHGHVWDPYVGADLKVGADLVLQAPDRGLVAVDQKTGGKAWADSKADPRKNVQAPHYLRLLKQLFPGLPYYRFVFDVMTYGGKFQRIISDPAPKHEDAVAEHARQFVGLYEREVVTLGNDLPANPSSTLCNPKWCDFWSTCPFGEALER